MNLVRPISALLWEISRRRRGAFIAFVAIILFEVAYKLAFPPWYLRLPEGEHLFNNLSGILMAAAVASVFAIFNFTESSPEKEWTGFPYRLFVLPLPTMLLIALPLVSAMVAMVLVCGFWGHFIFTSVDGPEWRWLTILLISGTVLFQTVLWCMAGFRIGRMLVLGLSGPAYVTVGFFPDGQKLWSLTWFSTTHLSWLLCGQMLLLFGCSWFFVARQRCGGGRRANWLRQFIDWLMDVLPRRKTDFASPAAAHFWFEWRRFGIILPCCIAGMLVFFIRPLSLHYQSDGVGSLFVLFWTLATPVILAAILGKGFSKPDFWSTELAYPAFSAVRPISSGEIVVVKMKVAALSTAISWALVIVFLAFWLPGWANLEELNTIRIGYWMAYDHSVLWENVLGILIIIAAVLATWTGMVSGLWTGLSGRRTTYLAPLIALGLLVGLGFVGLAIALNHDAEVRAWFTADPDRPLSWIEYVAAAAVVAKFILAARAWRNISPRRVWTYLFLWLCATASVMALVALLWAKGLFNLVLIGLFDFVPWDPDRVFAMLILFALLFFPLARIGLAPSSLARNRHLA